MSSALYREEQRLVASCVAGRDGAWEEFLGAYERLIQSVAWKLQGRAHEPVGEVEDLVAHVYEKLLENDCHRLTAWRGRAKLSTYLVPVARNLMLDYLKQRNKGVREELRESELVSEDGRNAMDEQEIFNERLESVRKAMRELSPSQALIIQMRLRGKSLREIADITNRPVGTVSVENSRALEKLRKILKRKADES